MNLRPMSEGVDEQGRVLYQVLTCELCLMLTSLDQQSVLLVYLSLRDCGPGSGGLKRSRLLSEQGVQQHGDDGL